jgi:hypothetical protein
MVVIDYKIKKNIPAKHLKNASQFHILFEPQVHFRTKPQRKNSTPIT